MRTPDLIIGPRDNPQTYRWHLLAWRGWQFALHKWWRSDEDRALHDHRADNISIILSRHGYVEVVREYREPRVAGWRPSRLRTLGWQQQADGRWYKDRRYTRSAWRVYFRKAETPHRVELHDARPVWSLWLRWPPRREWGFMCLKGWRHWKEFCSSRDYSTPGSTSEVGRGCD